MHLDAARKDDDEGLCGLARAKQRRMACRAAHWQGGKCRQGAGADRPRGRHGMRHAFGIRMPMFRGSIYRSQQFGQTAFAQTQQAQSLGFDIMDQHDHGVQPIP